ncbi:uroporphyrinogen-III synthase [Sphingomonas sp.]
MLRPEPGHAATVSRIREIGHEALSLPLFGIAALNWIPPDPAAFDSLLLTSANAVRMAGAGLARYRALPVTAVGAATANAARQAGLEVEAAGGGDGREALALLSENGRSRALHLAGRDHRLTQQPPIAALIAVYASEPLSPTYGALKRLEGTTALVHSPRAGRRLAALVDTAGIDRREIALAAISEAAAREAGMGWRSVAVASTPDDRAVIAAALSQGGGD